MDCVIGLGTAGTQIVKQLLMSGRSVRAVDFNDPAKMRDKFEPHGAHLELMQVRAALDVSSLGNRACISTIKLPHV